MSSLEIGDKVPVELHLSDGAIDQHPQGFVFDDEGNLLTIKDLVYNAHGCYYPTVPYVMPDEVYISIVYIVYTDAGHTTLSSVYERSKETFIRQDITAAKINEMHDEAFGKWELDPTAKTLTLYMADGISILKVFDLTDTTGTVPSFIGRTPQ
jgi:hypothetical protein